jgi:hypothetical protein
VEGIHPDKVFHFEVTLRQQFPEIESILPSLKSTVHNNHHLPIGRYNICVRHSIFPPFFVLLNSILSFFGGLERLYKVVLFVLVQQK